MDIIQMNPASNVRNNEKQNDLRFFTFPQNPCGCSHKLYLGDM